MPTYLSPLRAACPLHCVISPIASLALLLSHIVSASPVLYQTESQAGSMPGKGERDRKTQGRQGGTCSAQCDPFSCLLRASVNYAFLTLLVDRDVITMYNVMVSFWLTIFPLLSFTSTINSSCKKLKWCFGLFFNPVGEICRAHAPKEGFEHGIMTLLRWNSRPAVEKDIELSAFCSLSWAYAWPAVEVFWLAWVSDPHI